MQRFSGVEVCSTVACTADIVPRRVSIVLAQSIGIGQVSIAASAVTVSRRILLVLLKALFCDKRLITGFAIRHCLCACLFDGWH